MTRQVMIRFFLPFMREKEKTRVIAKDSRAEARRKSFRQDQNCAVFTGKMDQIMLEKPKFVSNIDKCGLQILSEICLFSSLCDAYAQIRWLI
jgi:hypothetical protein